MSFSEDLPISARGARKKRTELSPPLSFSLGEGENRPVAKGLLFGGEEEVLRLQILTLRPGNKALEGYMARSRTGRGA